MATYIQGLNDYIPQIQPFQPDYNFLSNILQTKQSRYDAANKQLSGIYGTLLNSPMSREQNVTRRDQFFQSINQDIQKISGMDLSLQQNVDTAMNVFKPFYEDKNLIKDMTWTKNWMNETERAENFKTCVDPDKCGGSYWEGGMEALQWKRQEFSKATDEQAMNFGNANFTPSVNVVDKAMKAAKDAGFSVKFDDIKGGYIVTTKNGERMIAPLTAFFTSKFGSDPTVTAYYKTQAYLERKNWVAANAEKFGGEDKATMQFMQEKMSTTQKKVENNAKDAEDDHNIINADKNIFDERIRKGGILLSETDLISGYQNMVVSNDASAGNKDYHNNVQNISKNIDTNIGNYTIVAEKFDEMNGLSKLSNEMMHAASIYSNLTAEQSLTADPYGLQASAFKYDMQKIQYQKGYIDAQGVYHPGVDAEQAVYINQQKAEIERKKFEAFMGPDKPMMVPNAPGSGTGAVEAGAAYKKNKDELSTLYVAADGDKVGYVNSIIGILETNSKVKGGLGSSTENLNKIFRAAGFKDSFAMTKAVLQGGQGRVDALKKLDSVKDSKTINSVYDMTIQLSDPSNKTWGSINNDWNQDAWNKTADQRVNVKNKQYLYDEVAVHSKEQMLNASTSVAGLYQSEKDETVPTEFTTNPQFQSSTGFKKSSIAELLANNTHNGIIPKDSQWKIKQAQAWADAHQNEFRGKDTFTGPMGTVSYYENEGATGPGGLKLPSPADALKNTPDIGHQAQSKKDVAFQFAMSQMDTVIGDMEKSYMTNGVAFNHADLYGKGSSGDLAMGFQYYADPAAVSRTGTLNLAELLRNYQGAQGNALVSYGNAGQKPEESDPNAQAIVNQFMTDYFAAPGKMVAGRAAGNFTFQRVAGNDKNLWAFTIQPNQDWITKHKGGKDNDGITGQMMPGGTYANQGVTVFMKHEDANNSLFTATEYDPYDFIIDKKGFLPIDGYPDAGNLQLTKIGNQFHVQGYINDMQSDGTFKKIPVDQPYNVDIEASVVFNDWNQKLGQLQSMIYQQRDYLRATTGVKDPNALLNLPTQ